MNKNGRLFLLLGHTILLVTIALLLLSSASFKRDGPTVNSVTDIHHAKASVNGGPWQEVELPHKFEGLEPRTPVSIVAQIIPRHDDSVYIKTVYSPAKIFLDGTLVFQFGKQENYPSFMLDPATELHMIETYGEGKPVELRMDFLSPVSRSSLVVHPPMVGTSKELIMERSRVLGIPLIFSLVQIVSGILLMVISLCISIIDKKGIVFLWMGLFSLTTGMWAFGENNFSSVIFRGSTFLYLMSFIGLFTFIIPLIRFTRTLIGFEKPRPLWYMEAFFSVSAAAALLLQLTGLVSCATSMYFFHLTLPIALMALTFFTVREYLYYKNINAKRYILPIGTLFVTAFMELLNYRFPLTYVFSSLFQLGILIFLLIMGIIAGLSIKDSINWKNTQKELSFEKHLMDIQVKEQDERNQILAHKEQQLRQQRHDLRHQLTVIQELASPENKPLQEYLQSMMDQIPKSEARFCENRAVNAVVAHYDTLCKGRGIRLETKLAVPPCAEHISDSELCVIFGNLLENALEACSRMTEGERFIRISSTCQYSILTITMDNSFNGQFSTRDGKALSAKRDDFGIGLASIRSVAKKFWGDVEFRPKGNVFLSSVYLKL